MDTAGVRGKTRALIVAVVVLEVLGNFFLSVGMRGVGRLVTVSPLPYIRALLNPWVALGVVLLTCWIIADLALLSLADLSYVLPVTAITYALTAFMGDVFLNERVSAVRWTGIALITAGVMSVSRTRSRTTPVRQPEQAKSSAAGDD